MSQVTHEGTPWEGGGYPDAFMDVRYANPLADMLMSPRLPPETVIIPSDAEVSRTYAAVARQSKAALSANTNLGQLLTHLAPRHEHIFRAWFGMFPYQGDSTPTQIAERFSIEEALVLLGFRRASRFVRDPALQPYTRVNAAPPLALEQIARLLCQNADSYDPTLVSLVCATKGLPPYKIPYSPVDFARCYNVPDHQVQQVHEMFLGQLAADAHYVPLPPAK